MGLPVQPVHRDVAQTGAAAIDDRALASLACDVSFVSDESAPPETIVAAHLQQLAEQQIANPRTVTLYWTIFDRLRTVYDSGSIIAHPAAVMMHIRQAMSGGIDFDETHTPALLNFFDRINRVMFQHQTIAWFSESQFKLHLYGAGWESNNAVARFARGPIDSDTTRLAIHRASRINLAASVYGALDTRVIEGITTGGFFLMRYCPADVIERIFSPLWVYCAKHQIKSNFELNAHATPAVTSLLAYASRTIGVDVLQAWPDLVTTLRASADAGFTQSAAAIWPNYPAIAFSSRDELIGLISRYLYDVPLRQRTAEDMRKQLVARFEHVRINRQLLNAAPRNEVAA